jgi:hypothetical protein
VGTSFFIGGDVKIILPTMFGGNVDIPDLRYCFPRDTVKTVKMVKTVMLSFLPNLSIRPVIFCSAARPSDKYGENGRAFAAAIVAVKASSKCKVNGKLVLGSCSKRNEQIDRLRRWRLKALQQQKDFKTLKKGLTRENRVGHFLRYLQGTTLPSIYVRLF